MHFANYQLEINRSDEFKKLSFELLALRQSKLKLRIVGCVGVYELSVAGSCVIGGSMVRYHGEPGTYLKGQTFGI